jgi:catechol 2,3-dioxygenase
MTTQEQQSASTAIDPATRVGVVALAVADLERSVAFYTDVFGFTVFARDTATATLGIPGAPLLLLREHPGARRWPEHGATGLYHFAVLVPTRADLGCWLRHWIEQTSHLPGQGDHLVSEALYLSDPDGNGIEIYRDRPRDAWRWVNGRVQMATDPVDIQGLLAEAAQRAEPWNGLPAGTRIGHIHLQVGDIPQAEAFYHGVLGFDVVAQLPSALFVSAGGYHHHIGLNTWQSRGAGPAPADTAGLRFFTLDFGSDAARDAVVARIRAAGIDCAQHEDVLVVHDPWRNRIALHIGTLADAPAAEALAAALA